jgi:succinate dehydrogenase / fumarate reductase iron-sulfur subunit
MTEQSQRSEPTPVREGHLPVSELVAEVQGGLSPFGEDVEFPLPAEQVAYRHPSAEDRPHLLGDADR